MKAIIINCFDTYENRASLIYNNLFNKGFEVRVLQSNFKHFSKTNIIDSKDNYIYIKTKKYSNNLSIARLISHYRFSKDVSKAIEKLNPDLLYVLIPPNYLTKTIAKYKKKNSNCKLIFDVIDLWPETLPFKKYKKTIMFKMWAKLRNRYLTVSDYIVTECDLFHNHLTSILGRINIETIYLAKQTIEITSAANRDASSINLIYLGSINNVIDIDKIVEIISFFTTVKEVNFHLIGNGSQRNRLINEVKNTGANVLYYGEIYDPQYKQDIFDKCDFALNIMKKDVYVGLTMKSIDYFFHGIPIINNIPADTKQIIEKYRIGINLFTDVNRELSKYDFNNLDKYDFRKNIGRAYDELFSECIFNEKLTIILGKIFNKNT